jgi:hypothetical protein
MSLSVNRPTADVEIITDYEPLQQAIDLGNEIKEHDDEDYEGLTESMAATLRKEQATRKKNLKKLLDSVADKTVVLHLTGLVSSKWNQIVVANTKITKGETVKDYPRMVADAIPAMVTLITNKKSGEPVEYDELELGELMNSIPDSVTYELIQTVQNLNTPVTAVPKALTQLLSQTD